MPTNTDLGHGGDRSIINLNEDWQVAYWTQRLNVTQEQLAALVATVGPIVNDVRKELAKSPLSWDR